MKKIDYVEDCLRIQKICLDNGYYGDLIECETLWQQYSTSIAASWLFLPETDEELWDQLEKFIN